MSTSEIPLDSDELPTALARAADLMNAAPRTCSKFSRVIEAVLIFKDEDSGMVPIVEEGKAIGVVTTRDVALAIATFPDLVDRPISDIMSTKLITVRPDASVEDVATVFHREGVRRVLVVGPETQLLGVIGFTDLPRALPDRPLDPAVTSAIPEPSRA
jgi:CBS domain-containing protein